MSAEIIDRQVNPTTTKSDQILTAPMDKTSQPDVTNPSTGLPAQRQPEVYLAALPVPLGQDSTTTRAIIPIPPNPNLPPNWIGSIESDTQVISTSPMNITATITQP
jgi:hypothetical protein